VDLKNAQAIGGGPSKPEWMTKSAGLQTDPTLKEYIPDVDEMLLHLPWHAVFFRLLDNKLPTYLLGEAGCGKSKTPVIYAAHRRLPILAISIDEQTPFAELLGRTGLDQGDTEFHKGILLKFIETPSVICLDEVNACTTGMFKFHQLLEDNKVFVPEANDGRGATFVKHPECRILVTSNPAGSRYTGSFRLNTALADRFEVMNVPPFSEAQIDQILTKRGVPQRTKQFAVQFYKEGRETIKRERMRAELSVRAMVGFANVLAAGVRPIEAMEVAAVNKIRLTAGDEAADAIKKLWRAICEKTETTETPKQT
jgi:MoxR-like ATPase